MIDNLIFVFEEEGEHVKRWQKLFKENFFESIFLSTAEFEIEEIARKINQVCTSSNSLVVSGPIDTVSKNLKIDNSNHLLLSYGYDLQVFDKELDDYLTNFPKLSGGIVIDSNVNRDYLRSKGFSEDRIFTIPWGVEDYWLKPLKHRSYNTKNFEFITMRAHENIYHVDSSIRLFQLLKPRFTNSHLYILGKGSLTKKLEAYVKEKEISECVTFLGHLDEKKICSLMSGCHFYLSSSEIDGSSVSLLQAMAMGLIPIVSKIPANFEWVENSITGFLINTTELEREVSNLVNHINLNDLNQISLNAHNKIVSNANWNENSQKLIGFIKNLQTTSNF